jgi:hypothetical protein
MRAAKSAKRDGVVNTLSSPSFANFVAQQPIQPILDKAAKLAEIELRQKRVYKKNEKSEDRRAKKMKTNDENLENVDGKAREAQTEAHLFKKFLNLQREKNLTEEQIITLFRAEILRDASSSLSNPGVDVCENCHQNYVHGSEPCVRYCLSCARTISVMDASASTVAYGEDLDYCSSAYRRVNHLNERLNRFQANEKTIIPQDVNEAVMQHLYHRGLRKASELDIDDVKEALKARGFHQYYDQIMQMFCHLTARKPIRLDPVFQEKFHLMFRHIQTPWERHCPEHRKNFVSYPVLMFMFSLLLKKFHLLPYFPLLKGQAKLNEQIDVFHKICEDLHWPKADIPAEFLKNR